MTPKKDKSGTVETITFVRSISRPGCDSMGKKLPVYDSRGFAKPTHCNVHGSSLDGGFCERCMSE